MGGTPKRLRRLEAGVGLALLLSCSPVIDGILDCDGVERGFDMVSDLPGRLTEVPFDVASDVLTGLDANDHLVYAPSVGGEPRDLIVVRDGREVARFRFVFDGEHWRSWRREACLGVEIDSMY